MEAPDEGSLELYEQVLDELQLLRPGIASKKMFGMPSLMIAGKPFAGLSGEDMIFKLSGEAHARALALPGAKPFDPMGGRPMKEWAAVPVNQVEHWQELAEAALDYVQGLTEKG